jgi:hypothetical protein
MCLIKTGSLQLFLDGNAITLDRTGSSITRRSIAAPISAVLAWV